MQRHLDDHEPQAPRRGGAFRVFAWVSILIVFYVLSVGPVLKVERSGDLKLTTLHTIYEPLLILAKASQGFNTFYFWYVFNLWKVQI